MFSCVPAILSRIRQATLSSVHYVPQLTSSLVPHSYPHSLTNYNHLPIVGQMAMQIRWMKDKNVLKLRCKDCYFKKIDHRWWVLCRAKPRHKQREKIEDIRRLWIVTHITRGGPNKNIIWRKHFQYPGHDL